MKIYLVGGAVRDQLLDLPVKDRDWVVTEASVDDMLAAGYKQVGKDFPVFLHPETGEEYALSRTERKTSRGYHGFEINASGEVTLEQDLQRRDLTVNALAQDADGNILDYVGGRKDLEERVLRHVSPAFAEDPVRILRVARFAARYARLGFSIADETLLLMQQMIKAGEVDALVPERVWQETVRALGEANPEVYFETLRETGALQVLFPEIDRLFGIPQVKKYHPEIDTGIHTMMVLQQAASLSDAAEVRFAALTHDLGKGTTPTDILPHHYGHEMRSYDLVKQLCSRYKIPQRFRELALLVAQYHTHIHRSSELKPRTVLKVLEACDPFRKAERFEQLLIACKADSRGRTGFESNPYPQLKYMKTAVEICNKVDIRQILEDGFEGKNIRNELHRRRMLALKKELHI
jgi:tRNA nucleotidyltransferase (CCA-adding enzyme)